MTIASGSFKLYFRASQDATEPSLGGSSHVPTYVLMGQKSLILPPKPYPDTSLSEALLHLMQVTFKFTG